MAKLEFWYEFASTYSYLSVMRIEPLAAATGVTIDWRPFLLGPIFKAQGWDTSPFNVYPAKGRFMVRDIERLATERGLAFALPEPFPANGLHAARLAQVGRAEGWCPAFSRAVFHAEFAAKEDIGRIEVLEPILRRLGIDAERALAASRQPQAKEAPRQETALAQQRGIFGAPSFITEDGELFWGDDRLPQALTWAKRF